MGQELRFLMRLMAYPAARDGNADSEREAPQPGTRLSRPTKHPSGHRPSPFQTLPTRTSNLTARRSSMAAYAYMMASRTVAKSKTRRDGCGLPGRHPGAQGCRCAPGTTPPRNPMLRTYHGLHDRRVADINPAHAGSGRPGGEATGRKRTVRSPRGDSAGPVRQARAAKVP